MIARILKDSGTKKPLRLERLREYSVVRLLFLFRFRAFGFFGFHERGLSGREPRHGHAEWRATHVAQSNPMAEFHTVGIATMFAADAELDLGPDFPAEVTSNFHKLAHSGLIHGRERVLFHDLSFLIRRQERAGIVAAHTE